MTMKLVSRARIQACQIADYFIIFALHEPGKHRRLDPVLSNKEAGARRSSKSSADFVRGGMKVVNFGQVKVRKVPFVT